MPRSRLQIQRLSPQMWQDLVGLFRDLESSKFIPVGEIANDTLGHLYRTLVEEIEGIMAKYNFHNLKIEDDPERSSGTISVAYNIATFIVAIFRDEVQKTGQSINDQRIESEINRGIEAIYEFSSENENPEISRGFR